MSQPAAPGTSGGTIRILVVDDHPAVRRGVSALIAATDDMTVIAAVASGEEAVVAAVEHAPDVVLMDISMPSMDGMEATRRVLAAAPESRIVMLTSFAGNERIREALSCGAVGYILKDSEPEEMLRGIRSAVRNVAASPDL